jgi:hypothetical protein
MKKFTVVCDFQGGQKSPFDFYIGAPEPTHHPIHCQAAWLSSTRGGTPPADIMESLQKLYTLANENNMDFEELCFYAMSNATQDKEDNNIKDPASEEEEIKTEEEENSEADNTEESN